MKIGTGCSTDYAALESAPRANTGKPDLPVELVKTLVKIANTLRKSEMLESGLSVRATEEACIYLNHPLFADKANESLTDILQSAFCARYNGRWTDPQSDAGIAWGLIQKTLRAGHKEKK